MGTYTINLVVSDKSDDLALNVFVPDRAEAPAWVAETPPKSFPLTEDQRRALFGTWRSAFGERAFSKDDRHDLTRAVLGIPSGTPVSWAANDAHTISSWQASRLLDVLSVLERII